MLSWRLQTGPEKAELRELNARLHDYLCRVRELERENLLLEEMLRGRRGQEGLWAEEQSRFSEEARGLRQQLDELSWATALAEGERDALRRELWELQRLGEETRAARDRLDAELGAQRRELQETRGARAALEARLGRLQAERRRLDEAHDRDVRGLRARAAGLALHRRARAPIPAAPPSPPRLREVRDSVALLVAEARRDAVQVFEDEVRELEEALRRGQESRREAEEETRLCAQEAEALRREALQLEQLRALLEDELQRMREAYDLQAEERQGVIACLENEKASLTLAMADRLRDYQDLVQVKTGLSLEVATYRALLEGESNPEILILNERLEKIPQDFRNTSYRYTTSALQRENERNLFLRQKAPSWSSSHGLSLCSGLSPHPWPHTAVGSAARRGLLGSSYSSFANTRWENGYETSFRTFPAAPSHGKHTEVQVKTFPGRPKANGTKDVPTRLVPESTVTQESRREGWDSVATGASESTRSNERTIILGKKIDIKATKEKENSRAGTVQTKRPEKMFDSKERASEERNLRWEELTKLDKEARERESQQMKEKEKEKELWKKKSARERDVPISVEVVKDDTPGASPKGFQTPPRTAAGLGLSGGVGMRETKFRPHSGDTTGSPTGDTVTETIAENIVSSVLKHFTKSPDKEAMADSFPDTKVTYVDRKEIPGDGKTKTEIVVESKLIEEVDASDEAGLDYLLREEVKDVELKGKSAERMIGDIINLGLKGREGRAKVVNVEIIEEPVSYIGSEKTQELSTPFKVEEVDDVSPGSRGLVEEEKGFGKTYVTFSGSQHQKTRQPQENVTHVEEVTEAGDSEGEQSYFVSTPEEYAGGHDRDGGPVYGQVHVEEESTIRYSWQDEIMPGTRRRRKGEEALGETVVKPVDIGEPSLEAGVRSTHWKEQARSGAFHAEPIVIEKEIKIAPGFHAARKGGHMEPRHQLVEVIGQLEESLPESVKTELSALSGEGQGGPGSVSVDVKKVQPPGGASLTLVAEVNLSQTVDADQLDLEKLSKDEAGEIEKAVESVVRGSLAKRHSTAPGSPETAEEVPAAGVLFKRWATQELYTPTHEEGGAGRAPHSSERVASQGPVLATVEVTSPQGFGRSHVLEDVSQTVRRIKVGPTGTWRTEQVSLEGPTAEVVQVSGEGSLGQAASSAGASWSVRHFSVGPQQSQVSKEVIFQGPGPACELAGAAQDSGPAELPTDSARPGSHGAFGSRRFHAEREVLFQGCVSTAGEAGDSFQTEEVLGTQTSVKHLQLGPRAGFGEQIQFIVPLLDSVKLDVTGDSGHTEGWAGDGTATRLVRLGRQTHHTIQQTVTPSGEWSDSESCAWREGPADRQGQAPGSASEGRGARTTEESTFYSTVSESPQEAGVGGVSGAEVTRGTSRSFRHIRLGPVETQTSEYAVFHGPISETSALAGSVGSPGGGELGDSSSTLKSVALGPKETLFTFQMDVSNIESSPRWTRETTGLFSAGAGVQARTGSDPGAWRDTGRGSDWAAGGGFQAAAGDRHKVPGEEGREFNKTVQLQRMVDTRSVISDEKKVALLYLDSQEEEAENEGHWF